MPQLSRVASIRVALISSISRPDDTPYVDKNGQYEVTLTNLGLQDEETAAMTIAHELGHLVEVGPYDEEGAERFAIRLLGGE